MHSGSRFDLITLKYFFSSNLKSNVSETDTDHKQVNPSVIIAFFPFHTWLDFSFLISRMETINKFAKTRVNILNFGRKSFFVKDHMSL